MGGGRGRGRGVNGGGGVGVNWGDGCKSLIPSNLPQIFVFVYEKMHIIQFSYMKIVR